MQEFIQQYQDAGYAIAPQLFSEAETAHFREHYTNMRLSGQRFPNDGDHALNDQDPLKRFDRLMHPHRWEETARNFLLDERIAYWLEQLTGRSPYAVQTMVYFKPAGARGQALHQDQFFLQVQPGTCIAAWLALDDCDEENGCLQIVPGTHNIPVLCTTDSDPNQSFSAHEAIVPDDMEPIPMRMKAGDVLFFNGQLVHGSYPNTSENRFRRALIGHYADGAAEKIAKWYHPVLRMDGSVVELGTSEQGGPCGVWVEQDGEKTVEISGIDNRLG